MIRCIDPQDGPDDLVPHAHRMTLQGTVGDLAFPPLCPNCGEQAARTIACSKVFRRADPVGESVSYVIETARPPFCEPCITRHRAEQVPPSTFELLRSGLSSMHVVGAVFPGLAAIAVLRLAFDDLLHARVMRGLVVLGFAAACALIAWLQLRAVWQQTAPQRVPPQSEVTRAFDFSDDTSPLFEGRRFVCTMRDERFAIAFRGLNLQNEWKPQSPTAVAARRRANWLTWGVGAAIALVWLWQWLHGR